MSPLALLRKKTGYTFTNCKKALEMHSNDVQKAEEWLHAQAKAEGWAKLNKLQDRAASQGLIGVIINRNSAAMVEVNCETDFVARNENFQSMVTLVARAALNYTMSKPKEESELYKTVLSKIDLAQLKSPDTNQALSDLVAVNVGMLGENISLRRAVCIKVDDQLHMGSYVHPPNTITGVSVGRFGGIVLFKQLPISPETQISELPSLQEVGYELAKQVVGMNPEKVGNKEEDKPNEDPDSESILIYQDCISNPNVTAGEYMEQNHVQLVDFHRFQCGEPITSERPASVAAGATSS